MNRWLHQPMPLNQRCHQNIFKKNYISYEPFCCIFTLHVAKWPSGLNRYTVCQQVCMLILPVVSWYRVGPTSGHRLSHAEVELATMNIEHFVSSAAQLGYQRRSGVGTIYSAGADPENLKGSGKMFNNLPRKSAKFFLKTCSQKF